MGLPNTLFKAGGLAASNEVEINLSGQRIQIRKTTAASDIEKLCEVITPGNLHADTLRGEPQGREVW